MLDPRPINLAQHCVADAMCAIQQQLAACFRGDANGCQIAQRRAAFATAQAIRHAREALRGERV
ncbi:MAG: hypothetical protein VYE22_08450 [Myxococcota bacterium]|nr:hypothetical protein [Myxococcota bacterium]